MTPIQRRALLSALATVLVAGVLPALAEPGYTGAVTDRSRICMMRDAVEPREGIELKHDGKSYFFCCAMCETQFREAPEKYASAVDPVSNARVDKATAPVYAFQGKAFFFESAANLKQFAAAPEQFVSRGR